MSTVAIPTFEDTLEDTLDLTLEPAPELSLDESALDAADHPDQTAHPEASATVVIVRRDSAPIPRVVMASVPPHVVDAVVSGADAPVTIGSVRGRTEYHHEVTAFVERQLTEARRPTSPRQEMLARAKAFIDHHIEDRDLSPEMIARGIFVSKRYLHIIFQEEETSVTRYVMRRRLELGRERLLSRRFAHVTVRELAERLGFKDASHFARSFKSAYGVTPSRFRRERLYT